MFGVFVSMYVFVSVVYLVFQEARESGSELLRGCQESNLGHPEDQPSLLSLVSPINFSESWLVSLVKRDDNPATYMATCDDHLNIPQYTT